MKLNLWKILSNTGAELKKSARGMVVRVLGEYVKRETVTHKKNIFDLLKKHKFSGILNIAGIGFHGWHTQKSCFVGIKFSV